MQVAFLFTLPGSVWGYLLISLIRSFAAGPAAQQSGSATQRFGSAAQWCRSAAQWWWSAAQQWGAQDPCVVPVNWWDVTNSKWWVILGWLLNLFFSGIFSPYNMLTHSLRLGRDWKECGRRSEGWHGVRLAMHISVLFLELGMDAPRNYNQALMLQGTFCWPTELRMWYHCRILAFSEYVRHLASDILLDFPEAIKFTELKAVHKWE